MGYTGTYDGTIFYNPLSHYAVIIIKTDDQSIPAHARSDRRYPDHLIRFTAVGYDLPLTDAVDMELEGEWVDSKHGPQLKVEQCQERIKPTTEGIQGYLASGLIKGIGEKTAQAIVVRFGMDSLTILEHHPERLLEIKGITPEKLEDIKNSYAQSRMLRDLMTLLSPFKITPVTAQKIYQHFGAASVDILKKSPFSLCQISGFGFQRVDAIVRRTDNRPHDPMRIRGALFYCLNDAKNTKGHLYLPANELCKIALNLLNKTIPLPEQRLHSQEITPVLEEMILNGVVVSNRDNIYLPPVFAQEDTMARQLATLLVAPPPKKQIKHLLQQVLSDSGLSLSPKQEAAVHTAFLYHISIITGPPGTGKTTVIKTILEVCRKQNKDAKILLMAPTGRASRRMAESSGCPDAKTMHNGMSLTGEESGNGWHTEKVMFEADLIIVDEFSLSDMWLSNQFFSRIKPGTQLVLVGDPDQLPSVGAGNVFREMIQCGIIPVTVLDQIFRQNADNLIAINAKLIKEGNAKLFYGNDFSFLNCEDQSCAAEIIMDTYCKEISRSGIEQVMILSPFRSDGDTSANQLNQAIRELVNPFCSTEEEVKLGAKSFRVGDRIMQTKNTDTVSNGDLGFIRSIQETAKGTRIFLEFSDNRKLEYAPENMANVELAYATTIHKAMGSECDIVIIPILKAHSIMLYRNLIYTAVTRAKKRVILVGQKPALFMAIHRNEISKRNTLLGQRIILYYRAFAKSAGIPFPAALEEKLKQAG